MTEEKLKFRYMVGIPILAMLSVVGGRRVISDISDLINQSKPYITNSAQKEPALSKIPASKLEGIVENPEEQPERQSTHQAYSQEDFLEISRILYAESADQPQQNRRLIARTILNRMQSKDYPNTIYNVIHQKNAFTCIFDKKNKNWRQATGKLQMNDYEKMVFKRCSEDAKSVLENKKENIKRENEIIAYHDISIQKPNDSYWNSLEPVHSSGRLIFYAPKINQALIK